MTRRMRWLCGLALVLALPGIARAGEVRLAFKDGRVELAARDATLRDILVEWERVGGTHIVNRDRVPATRLTLDLVSVPEDEALATLLRPIAGYVASRRIDAGGGPSSFSRIVLMPGLATPVTYAASGQAPAAVPPRMGMPPGRQGVQRRVLPDGRIVTVVDEPQQADEPDDTGQPRSGMNAPGLMRPPFNAPPRQPGEDENAAPEPQAQPGQVAPTTSVAPIVPTATLPKPGALPITKPGATPPPPIKPPGD